MSEETLTYWYCPDIIDQGVKDQSTLAAYLMETECWFFWWD
ncbi:MAG: DUF4253 domain-containing protein [Rhodobacteraceae bacterium]|nr:DUF4253 domain-containing protein [Paracoccaceae bacterium]